MKKFFSISCVVLLSGVLSADEIQQAIGIVNVGDGRGILAFEGGSGTLTQIVNNRYLITVQGSGVTEAEMTLFAGAVDISKLSDR